MNFRRGICACVIFVALLMFLYCLGVGQPYRYCYSDGSIQVLGGHEEAWFFIDKRIAVEQWGGEQPWLGVASSQEVVVITRNAVKTRISIPEKRAVTVHINLGRIFRQQQEFFLLRGESWGTYGSLFKWGNSHFDLLPLQNCVAFRKAYGQDRGLTPPDDSTLDRLTEENGWKHLCSRYGESDVSTNFAWNGQRFEISVERSPAAARVLLHSLGPGPKWDTVLLEFDPRPKEITRSEYLKLRNQKEPGYNKTGS